MHTLACALHSQLGELGPWHLEAFAPGLLRVTALLPPCQFVATIGVLKVNHGLPVPVPPQALDGERKGGLTELRAEARPAHVHQCAQAQPRSFRITLRFHLPEVGHPALEEQMRAAIGCSRCPSGRSLFLTSLAAGERPPLSSAYRSEALSHRRSRNWRRPRTATAHFRRGPPRCLPSPAALSLPTPRPSTMAASVWCREKLALGAFP